MANWVKADIKNQLDLVCMLKEVRKYYRYRATDEEQYIFRKIEVDYFHEVKILLIIAEEWAKSYRKAHIDNLEKYYDLMNEEPNNAICLQVIGYVKTLIS